MVSSRTGLIDPLSAISKHLMHLIICLLWMVSSPASKDSIAEQIKTQKSLFLWNIVRPQALYLQYVCAYPDTAARLELSGEKETQELCLSQSYSTELSKVATSVCRVCCTNSLLQPMQKCTSAWQNITVFLDKGMGRCWADVPAFVALLVRNPQAVWDQ